MVRFSSGQKKVRIKVWFIKLIFMIIKSALSWSQILIQLLIRKIDHGMMDANLPGYIELNASSGNSGLALIRFLKMKLKKLLH